VSGKKVMVTGAAGFIGSHLAERLLAEGDSVYAFDYVPLADAVNLAAVADHPNLFYTQGDIRDRATVEAFYRPEAEIIYHLASVVGIPKYVADPLYLVDVVVLGTRWLVELALRHNTRFIFSSTSEIYGRNPAVPWAETDDRVLGPTSVDRWSYSSAKAVCEHMLFGAGHQEDFRFAIVRFFNVYGPRQNPIFVVSQSVKRAVEGLPPLVYDGGGMTRCYTYIDDIIDALVLCAENDAVLGEVVNLGNEVESSVNEVVAAVLENTNPSLGVEAVDTGVHYGAKYEDIPRRAPDASKALRLLGWKATTQIAEGVAKTVEWARGYYPDAKR
jgi:dTDP-alpha-D-glucuronic acid decarboxylase